MAEATAAPADAAPGASTLTRTTAPLERDYLAPSIAVVLLFAIGLQLDVHAGVTVGDGLLVVTAALWLLAYRRYRGAGAFLGWGLLTAVGGIVLAEYQSSVRQIDHSTLRDSTVLLLGLLAGVAAVLWARTVLPPAVIATAFGFGMVVGAVLHRGSWSTNPWKYAFSAPVTVLVIGLTLFAKRASAGIVPLLLLAAVSLVFDYRAYTATLTLAALLLLWRCLPKRESTRYGWVWTVVMIAGAAGLLYWLGSNLLVSGYLGKDVQARTVAQISTSGSLILGGRPELAATWALLRHDPGGFGVGAVPTPNDVLVAKQGLQGINYDPNNGYVERFMFGGHFELHSVVGDVWAYWGIPGLLVVAAVAWLMIRALSQSVSRRQGDALVVYLCLWTLWNLMFSPLEPTVPILVLALGFAFRARSSEPAEQRA